MSANRRFFALDTKSIFTITIDTRFINVGATDGSENPNTFNLPISVSGNNNFILQVNDGRPDVSVVSTGGTATHRLITVATPGIYRITMVGTINSWQFYQTWGYDRKKITEVNNWGDRVGLGLRSFENCINLTIKAYNTLSLRSNVGAMFSGIKGFESPVSLVDVANVDSHAGMMRNISNGLVSSLNPIQNNLISFNQVYNDTDMSAVPEILVISDTITSFSNCFSNTNFRGTLKLLCPNVNNYFRILYGITNPPSLGWVDIRSATTIADPFQYVMSTANVDATLLGWVNNFDWSGIAPVVNKATLNWKNSKYSNNPTVIAAKAFLEAKGYVFTNLTMV